MSTQESYPVFGNPRHLSTSYSFNGIPITADRFMEMVNRQPSGAGFTFLFNAARQSNRVIGIRTYEQQYAKGTETWQERIYDSTSWNWAANISGLLVQTPQNPNIPGQTNHAPQSRDCKTPNDLLNDPVIKEYAEKLWNRTLESGHENGFVLILEPAANRIYLESLSEGRTLRAGKTQYAPEREAMPDAGPETDAYLSNHRRAGRKVMLLAFFHTHPNLYNGESRSDVGDDDPQFSADYGNALGIIRHGDGYTFLGVLVSLFIPAPVKRTCALHIIQQLFSEHL